MKIVDGGVMLAALTAYLYSSSTAYTHGYYSVLELNSEVLDRNFHQILYGGMILNIWVAIGVPLIVAVLVTLHSLFVVGLSGYINRSFSNGRNIRRLKTRLGLQTKRDQTRRLKRAWLTSFCSIGLLVFLAYFEQKGTSDATKLKNKISAGTAGMVEVKLDNEKFNLVRPFAPCAGSNDPVQRSVDSHW